ncbi:MAG: hypothetical protein J6V09_06065 [Clostridia bacterium]|nr:hypothetical protein [Clostridia bacterium]
MKNLKKLFVVLAVLVAMVCAVTTIVIAETTYDGTLAKAEIKLAAFDTAKDQVDESGVILVSALKAKENALADTMAYLKTVDPASEGYDAFVAKLNGKRVDLGNLYLAEVDKAAVDTDRTKALKVAYDYAATLTPDMAGYADFIMAYNEKSFAIVEKYLDQLFGTG